MQMNDCVWFGALRWLFCMHARQVKGSKQEGLTEVAQCDETRDINSVGDQTTCIIIVIAQV